MRKDLTLYDHTYVEYNRDLNLFIELSSNDKQPSLDHREKKCFGLPSDLFILFNVYLKMM